MEVAVSFAPQMLLFKSTSASERRHTFSLCAAGYLLMQPKCSAAGYNSSTPQLQRARLGAAEKQHRKWLFEPKIMLYEILLILDSE